MNLHRVLLVAAITATALAPIPAHAAPKKPAKAYDFNGDGRQDVVVGVPAKAAVAVSLSDAKGRRLVPVPASNALASADFDRDGFADLAVNAEGGVTIVYGSRKGLSKRRAVLATGPGLVADRSVAAGDLDRDGRADLVAGVGGGYWTFGGVGRGRVTGVDHRVTAEPAEKPGWTFSRPGGFSPVLGDHDGDGNLDAVLLPYGGRYVNERNEPWGDPAPMLFVKGTRAGLGEASYLPHAGGTVAASGDFNGDGYTDLISGGRFHAYEAPPPAQVVIAYGGPDGLGRTTTINQDSPGIPGKYVSDVGDGWGRTVAVGDINGDGRADVAIGGPTDTEALKDTGGADVEIFRNSVTLLFGSRTGLTARGAKRITAASPGIPGRTGVKDRFGAAVRFADLNGDRRPELLIGVPGAHAVYLLRNAGSTIRTTGVTVLRPTAFGLPRSSSFGDLLP